MPATTSLFCHVFFLRIKYLNKTLNTFINKLTHTAWPPEFELQWQASPSTFKIKKKYFKKLTRTSYMNKKDHWLLFLKNPAQIRFKKRRFLINSIFLISNCIFPILLYWKRRDGTGCAYLIFFWEYLMLLLMACQWRQRANPCDHRVDTYRELS